MRAAFDEGDLDKFKSILKESGRTRTYSPDRTAYNNKRTGFNIMAHVLYQVIDKEPEKLEFFEALLPYCRNVDTQFRAGGGTGEFYGSKVTALIYAVALDCGKNIKTKIKCIELLLKHGAPVNTIKGKRSNGESSLMCLCGLKRFLLATTLQRIGLSKVEAEPIMDCYLPCLDKFLERAFDMLVKAGADVNFEDSQEDSPATVCTSSKLLKKLIEEGSYILQKNRNWKTLLDNIMDTMSADSLYHIFCQDEYEMIDGFIKQASKQASGTIRR